MGAPPAVLEAKFVGRLCICPLAAAKGATLIATISEQKRAREVLIRRPHAQNAPRDLYTNKQYNSIRKRNIEQKKKNLTDNQRARQG